MGFFSKKKKSSNENIKFIGIQGQAASIKSIVLAGVRGVSMDVDFAEFNGNPDQLNNYQTINASDKAPNITQGDFTVSGGRGIQTYIDIRGKGASLYPKKARVLGQQNYWIEVGNRILAPTVHAISSGDASDADHAQCNEVLASLNNILADNKFIAGPLSLADPQIAAYVYVLRAAGNDLKDYSNVNDWVGRLENEMPSDLKDKYTSLVS